MQLEAGLGEIVMDLVSVLRSLVQRAYFCFTKTTSGCSFCYFFGYPSMLSQSHFLNPTRPFVFLSM